MEPENELWKATSEKNLEKVEEILQNHPSLNINWGDPEYERTSLYRACGYAGSPEIVKRLLLHPAILPNQPYKKGATPLYIACQLGHPEVLRVLLNDDRIDPNLPDPEGLTPLLYRMLQLARGLRAFAIRGRSDRSKHPKGEQYQPAVDGGAEGI